MKKRKSRSPEHIITVQEMVARDDESVIDIEKAEPKKVVDDEVEIAVCFITEMLENRSDRAVESHENKNRKFVSQSFSASVNIASVNSSKASH